MYEQHGGCLKKSKNCLPFVNTWVHTRCFGGSVLLIILVVYVVQLCVFTFLVPHCDVHYVRAWGRACVPFSGLTVLDCPFGFVYYWFIIIIIICDAVFTRNYLLCLSLAFGVFHSYWLYNTCLTELLLLMLLLIMYRINIKSIGWFICLCLLNNHKQHL